MDPIQLQELENDSNIVMADLDIEKCKMKHRFIRFPYETLSHSKASIHGFIYDLFDLELDDSSEYDNITIYTLPWLGNSWLGDPLGRDNSPIFQTCLANNLRVTICEESTPDSFELIKMLILDVKFVII